MNRPARPTGARPLPSRPSLPASDENIPPRSESAMSVRPDPSQTSSEEVNKMPTLSKRASMPSAGSFSSLPSYKGRPLVQSPNPGAPTIRRKISPTATIHPYVPEQESTSRAQERDEAKALRRALERVDHKTEDDEQRIHESAKAEAADLVWRHRNPQAAEVEKTAAYRNPDLPVVEKTKRYGELVVAKTSEGSTGPASAPAPAPMIRANTAAPALETQDTGRNRLPWLRRPKKSELYDSPQPTQEKQVQPDQKTTEKAKTSRTVSSGSSKGLFRNPEDQIYEEPEDTPKKMTTTSQPLALRPFERNSLRGSRPLPQKSQTMPVQSSAKPVPETKPQSIPTEIEEVHYSDIFDVSEVDEPDSPQTPMKNGLEIRSDDIRAATTMKRKDRSPNLPTPTAVSDRPGRPIVSFDPKWRAATADDSPRNSIDTPTGKNKNDGSMSYPVPESPKGPVITIMEAPSIVMTSPPQENSSSRIPVDVPSISISAGEPAHPITQQQPPRLLPSIQIDDETFTQSNALSGEPPSRPLPSINTSTEPVRPLPSINIPTESTQRPLPKINGPIEPQGRPLPSINVTQNSTPSRPLPPHTQSSPSRIPPSRTPKADLAARVPWLSRTPTTSGVVTVTCDACTLPISGRIVTASGSATTSKKARFHPECFSCHHCSTSLECVSFYPEPDTARFERLQAALPHLDADAPELVAFATSTADLHFFCHLDYHELFSPRCHTCKTPVEGAVVLALGRHYHADHFFCAECGDPFTSASPFVEHNNYPYCVTCHTKRTSARCRACKKQILDEMTVEALGAKWHDECFVCMECGGEFGEGRFFVREVQVELTEKEKRRGAQPKWEERAACQGCEERRVKNSGAFR